MAGRLTRRVLSQHVAKRLQAGDEAVLDELAALLVRESREREADILVRDIEDQLESLGVLVVNVETAHKLSSSALASIKQQFSAKEIQVREIIRPDLIGGVRITTPTKELDQTIANKLKALRSTNL